MPSTPQVDLTQISPLAEIVVRGGNFSDPRSRQSLRDQYATRNRYYPDLPVGLSCLFRPGSSLDELAREGSYYNTNLSVAIVQLLIDELAATGRLLALYVSPVTVLPDPHTLVVLRNGMLEPALRDDVLDALIRAMVVVKNPYRRSTKNRP